MWIARSEFERFKKLEQDLKEVTGAKIKAEREVCELKDAVSNLEKRNAELCDSAEKLAMQISAEVTDCQVGPWCWDCAHYADVPICRVQEGFEGTSGKWVWRRGENVQYCKKHLHDLCPEFERWGGRC